VDRDAGAAARALLEHAIEDRIFPAATAEVGNSRGAIWRTTAGALTFDEGAPPADDSTIFDLASLTKPIATTSAIMQLAGRGALDILEPVATFFSEWRGADRESATVQDLLEHSAGLAARLIDLPPHGRREFEHEICTMLLEYPPRSKSVYSDLGFILLGFIAEDRGRATLASQFETIAAGLPRAFAPGMLSHDDRVLTFGVTDAMRARAAPTRPLDEDARRGRLLVGEVHDNYAAALGGVAGHAGMFGTAAGVGDFARAILRGARGDGASPAPLSPRLVAQATRKSSVAGSSRALGWDTMLPTSSCGTAMSPAAFGQVGYTGTSLWIDPGWDRYFVLLTNRACGGGSLEQMREVRRAFHNSVVGQL
jgi:CubicO group peptidase (beta-lactamase class C family)